MRFRYALLPRDPHLKELLVSYH